LLPCWVQASPLRPRRPDEIPVAIPAHHHGVAVAGQRDGGAQSGGSVHLGADQLAALLDPGIAAAGKDPRRPDARIVLGRAQDDGVAVAGQRDGGALLSASGRAGADQLAALLAPGIAVACKDPRRPGIPASAGPPTTAVLPSADSETEKP
jgi:hypothetical protein